MSNTNEKTIFNRIAKYSTSEILSHFQQDDANVTLKKTGIHRFIYNENPEYWVTVSLLSQGNDQYSAPVNADFGFARPAGSNNYPELLTIGRKLANAFCIELPWD